MSKKNNHGDKGIDPVFKPLTKAEEDKFQEALPEVYKAFPELFVDLFEEGETVENPPDEKVIRERLKKKSEDLKPG